MSCIYKITNLTNNKIYIGLSTKSYIERFSSHKNSCNSKVNENCLLAKAIVKYGKENFKSELIVEGDFNAEFLDYLEQHYIRLYNSYAGTSKFGYNLTTGGRGTKKKIISKKTRLKMKRAQKGKVHTEEWKKNMSEKMKGRIISSETKLKMSKAQKGRIITEDTRKKIAETLKGHSNNKGIPKSEEHKEKIRQTLLKRKELKNA